MASRCLMLCDIHLAGAARAPPRAAALHAVRLPPHHPPACGLQGGTGRAGGRAWMRLCAVAAQWQRQQQSSNSATASQQAASLSPHIHQQVVGQRPQVFQAAAHQVTAARGGRRALHQPGGNAG